jgi:hypothetical protein
LLAAIPTVAAPLHLRAQVLVDASLAGVATPPRGWDGVWPPPMYRSTGRRLLAGLVAAVVLVGLVLGGVLLAVSGNDDESGTPAASSSGTTVTTSSSAGGGSTTTTAEPSSTTTEATTSSTTSSSTTSSSTTSTTAPPGATGQLTLPRSVEFGSAASSGTVTISNNSTAPVTWAASPGAGWMGVSPRGGSIDPGGTASFFVTVNRSMLAEGGFSAPVRLETTLGDAAIAVHGTVERSPRLRQVGADQVELRVQGCPAPTVANAFVTVEDESGVGSVVLVWSKDGGGEQRKGMTSGGGGRYGASLGPFPGTGSVTFRIEATDTRGNTARSTSGTLRIVDC